MTLILTCFLAGKTQQVENARLFNFCLFMSPTPLKILVSKFFLWASKFSSKVLRKPISYMGTCEKWETTKSEPPFQTWFPRSHTVETSCSPQPSWVSLLSCLQFLCCRLVTDTLDYLALKFEDKKPIITGSLFALWAMWFLPEET